MNEIKPELEQLIIRNIVTNTPYMRKVIPFLKKSYFTGPYKLLFNEVVAYVNKYNITPTSDALVVEMDRSDDISDGLYREAMDCLPSVFTQSDENLEWLVDTTESWCKERAIYLAVMESISIIDGKHDSMSTGSLPSLLQDALAVSFNTNIGHDYIESAEDRYEFYHTTEDRIPFDLDYFNRITNGGLPNKTLNICLAGTGVGKSLFMCHIAADALSQGRNVLYITMEMAEEKIAERIDANLMDVEIQKLRTLDKSQFMGRIDKIRSKSTGRLMINEFPTGQSHAGHFRHLLQELKLKKKFSPDIIFIDYLNICASSRIKNMGGSINSYTYIKAIAEELRGLAGEFDVPIMSATQTTRTGFQSSDPGLEDTSESFGLPATADLMFALVSNEELEESGQLMVKQLKNRYNDVNNNKRFLIGVDRSKMRLFDLDESEQSLINDTGHLNKPEDDTPIFDKGAFSSSSSSKISGLNFQMS